MNRQSGFAVVELVVVVALLAAVAGTGYYVMHVRSQKNQPTTATTSTSTGYQSPSVAAPAAPQVNSAADLNSAAQALDQTNVTASNTDSNQLSTQASGL